MLNEILIKILERDRIQITLPNLPDDLGNAVEGECYKMLAEIRDIVDDDSIDDPECFMKTESIIRIFEEMDALKGIRHDF